MNKAKKTGVLLGQAKTDSRKFRSEKVETDLFNKHITRQTRRQADLDYMAMEEDLEVARLDKWEALREEEKKEEVRLEVVRKQKIKKTFERAKAIKDAAAERTAAVEAEMLAKVNSFYAGRESDPKSTSRMSSRRGSGAASGGSPQTRIGTPERPQSSERLKPLDLSGNVSGAATAGKTDIVAEIRARRVELEHARTQRDKRRRRALQHETDLLRQADDEKRGLLQLANVMKRSQQERRIATQLVHARHEQDVIRENRAFREKEHRERRRRDFAAALEREAQYAKHIAEQNKASIAQEEQRLADLRAAREAARLEEVHRVVKACLLQVVDLTTKCGALREVSGKGVPAPVFREWKELVLAGKPLYPEDVASIPGGAAEDPEAAVTLDDHDFNDYHAVNNDWKTIMEKVPDTPAAELPEGSDEAAAAAAAAAAEGDGDAEGGEAEPAIEPFELNRVLGHVLDRIATVVKPKPEPPAPPDFPAARLRAAVVGKPFAGKTDALKVFAEAHGAALISVGDLIDRAVTVHEESSVKIRRSLVELFAKADVTDGVKTMDSNFGPDNILDKTELRFRMNRTELSRLLKMAGVFEKFDTDGDGSLSFSEILTEMDTDGDGEVSMHEFLVSVLGVLGATNPPTAEQVQQSLQIEQAEAEEVAAAAAAEAAATAAAETEGGGEGEATAAAEEGEGAPAADEAAGGEVEAAPAAEGETEAAAVDTEADAAPADADADADADAAPAAEDAAAAAAAAASTADGGDCEPAAPAPPAFVPAPPLQAAPAAPPIMEAVVVEPMDPLVEIGRDIARCTEEGGAVSDEVIARLVVFAIRESDTSKGWILDGFPLSVSQAKVLEKALTGRDDEWGKEHVPWASLLAPVAEDERTPPPLPPPCGFDAVIHLDIDSSLAIRRAVGRRVDPETGTTYHLEGLGFPTPPPVPEQDPDAEPDVDPAAEIVGLHARLVPVEDASNEELQIQRRLEIWDKEGPAALEWYGATFPGSTHTINAGETRDGVSDALTALLLKVGKYEELNAEAELEQQLGAEEEAAVVEADVLSELTGQVEVEAAIKTELEDDEAAAAAAAAEAARLAEEAAAAEAASGKKPKKEKPKKGGNPEDEVPDGADLEAFVQGEEQAHQQEELAKVVVIKPGEPGYAYRSDEASADLELAQWLNSSWDNLEEHYVTSIKVALRGLRLSRDDLVAYLHQTKLDYAEFLTRPDSKQEFVADWQQAYNEMPKDMRDDPETKAELHKRAAELQDTLWDICATREDEAEKELDAIKNDGFVQDHAAIVINHYTTMMQTEVDRYNDTNSVLGDYYTALKGEMVAEEAAAAVILPVVNVVPEGRDDAAAAADDGAAAEGGENADAATAADGDGNGDGDAAAAADDVGGDAPEAAAAEPAAPADSAAGDGEAEEEQDPNALIQFVPRAIDGLESNLAQIQGVVDSALASIPERIDPAEVRAQLAAEEAAAKEKEEKANAKAKGKPKKGEAEEEVAEPTQEELDELEALRVKQQLNDDMMDEEHAALLVEDARFRTRVELIRRACVDLLEQVWGRAEALWGHMNVCGKHRNDAETRSILRLIGDIKGAIEAEERLLNELVLHGQDYSVNQAVYMYDPPQPPPIPSAPEEERTPDTFTIAQLELLTEQFRSVTTETTMPLRNFQLLLQGLSSVSVGTGLLPESWLGLSQAKVESISSHFSVGSAVDWRSLVVAAMEIPMPSVDDALGTAKALNALVAGDGVAAGTVTYEQFESVALWFEAPVAPGVFNRAAATKALLFQLVCTGDGVNEPQVAAVTALVQWLLRSQDPIEALQVSIAVARGELDAAFDVDAEVDREELYVALHRSAVKPISVSETNAADPTGREALFLLWQAPGPKTLFVLFLADDAQLLLQDFVAQHFGPISLSALVADARPPTAATLAV